jgi:hypothetical protein
MPCDTQANEPVSLLQAFGQSAARPDCVTQPQLVATSPQAPACSVNVLHDGNINDLLAQRWNMNPKAHQGQVCARELPNNKCSSALDKYYLEGRPIMNARAPHRPQPELPALQAIYKEPSRPLQQRHNDRYKADPPTNYFEEAFRIYDDSDTPKSLGVAPQNGRGTGPPLRIDALRPNELKPAKSHVTQSELKGAPAPDNSERGNQSVAHLERCRAEEHSKWHRGSGALNGYRPDVSNQKQGYSTGAIIQPRGGGYHPMARFMVPQEYKRERIMYGRPGGPQALTTKLPLVGQIRCNPNYQTNEYHRFPVPQLKRRAGYELRPDCVAMKPVQRGPAFEYGGPAGTAQQVQSELRPCTMAIRPKNLQEFAYSGQRGGEGKLGAYLVTQPLKRAKNLVEFAYSGHRAGDGAPGSYAVTEPLKRAKNLVEFSYSGQRTGDGAPGSYAVTDPLKRAKNMVEFAYSGQRTGDSTGLGYLVEEHNVLPTERDLLARSVHPTGGAFRNRGEPGAELSNYETGRADPCLPVKEFTTRDGGCSTGAGRPAGPVWASNGIADALHPQRMTDAVLLDTQNKDTGLESMDKRQPVPDKTYVVQYDQAQPCNKVRKVSPDIIQEIDPTLLLAYKSNPYTQPILN